VTSETIIVPVGAEFTVRLKSTPTTGYVWEVHTLPESIQLLGSDYEKSAGVIQPGDQVIQVFRLRTLKPGEHIINFVLKRQWESNTIESHTVTVKDS
jgi:predicted secreted protein